MRQTATAFAPGSVGNVGPGLDVLGLAVAGRGDEARLTRRDEPGIAIVDAGHAELPSDPQQHSTAIAALAVFARAGYRGGASLVVTKGLPLSGGQGGSAASAVAGAVAANHLLDAGLDHAALLACALEAETAVAGRHADNLGPSLLGGLVLIRSLDPIDMIKLPIPDALHVVLVHPDQQLRTRDARAVLPETISRAVALSQAANIAAMVAGACLGDIALLPAAHSMTRSPSRCARNCCQDSRLRKLRHSPQVQRAARSAAPARRRSHWCATWRLARASPKQWSLRMPPPECARRREWRKWIGKERPFNDRPQQLAALRQLWP